MRSCDGGFALDPSDDIAALSADSVGQDNEGVNARNTYNTTAVPVSPLECGPSETNTRVLDSHKNKVEKYVASSSSLEPHPKSQEICLDIGVENLAQGTVHPTSALLDSGANSIFIDQVWAEHIGLPLVKLDISIPVYNIDGWTWLFKHNPEINWQTGVVTLSRCPLECKNLGKPSPVRQTELNERINAGHVYAKLRSLEKIDKDNDEVKPEEEIKRLVPPKYHDLFVPTNKTITATGTADLFKDFIWSIHCNNQEGRWSQKSRAAHVEAHFSLSFACVVFG
ncbi:hypothetical protein SERLA73DRAFT_77640 [Serpula lacrymans var. lacrymans S7.3]|uniref:Peptidase A2 domain-containing protein n=1 Tax=Serpula lacrymans var. lacrymans (strain S7.3) TaxID=936435 RepID=F8QA01_SERL3|nr:hypothetical protein SERLA73DRAFT_77640 [Serpula lacrymans var. lacrymans S7.3]